MFSRKIPVLHYQEDDTLIEDLAKVLAKGETVHLPGEDSTIPMDPIHEEVPIAPSPMNMEFLRPLTFEDDIEKFLDIARPYYALENEHAIVDNETGEMVGFVCTGRVEMPAGRESGGIPFAEAGRHMAAAGSVAALLRNPQKKRFHYPASQYHCDVNPYKGRIKEELDNISGGDQFSSATNDPIIFVRCTDFSKRKAKCDIILENADATWELNIDFSIVSALLFKKKYPPPPALPKSAKSNCESPYEAFGELNNIKSFSDFSGEWLTMEATLPPCKRSDCKGHFYDNPTLAHSVMLFHNGDLLGKAISEFTGLDLPFKRSDFGQEHGMKMLSWNCLPQNLHFPDTYGLKLQSKVFLSKGELGKPGSTYSVQCEVKQDTGTVCYKATGSFILEPIKFLKTEFRRAIRLEDFDALWKKLDINGDGVVSREELHQFVGSSGMADLDDKEFDLLFDSIDADNNGELSHAEIVSYFNSLHESIKEDFGNSIARFFESGSDEELTVLWAKLDMNSDGEVSREEFAHFVSSEIEELSSQEANKLHHDIDTNGDGIISFTEFECHLRKLRHDSLEHGFLCLPT